MLLDPIILTEVLDKHVKFGVNSVIDSTDYFLEYSQMITLDGNNQLHNELISQINTQCTNNQTPKPNWTKVKYLILVFLRAHDSNLQESLIRAYVEQSPPNNTDETFGNGLVVSVDANEEVMKIIHKPKRTKGKVSNSLG